METRHSIHGNHEKRPLQKNNHLSINNVDLKLLRVFKCVVESGGFTSASNELNIGLAAISKQISDLEVRLGMRLCTRGRDGFFLTNHGIIVYQASLELFCSIDQFRDKVYSSRNDILGEINISVIDNTISDPRSPVTKAVHDLHLAAPKVHIRLNTMQLEDIERGLAEGRISCAIAPVYKQKEEFDYYELYKEEAKLYCSNEHAFFNLNNDEITLERLRQVHIINHTYATPFHNTHIFNFRKSAIQAVQIEAVAMLILTGCFIGYLPVHYAEPFVQAHRLRSIGPQEVTVTTPLCFVVKKGRELNKIVKLLMQSLNIQ